jgi:hypothetical protein
MKTRAFLLLLLTSAFLHGATVLTFNPPGGALQGNPGQTVFWNFHFANSVNFLLIDQVDYITLTPVGTFTDLFSATAPVIGPGEAVDGLASYSIDPPAPFGFLSTGQLVISYDEFLVSPNDPGFDFDRDHVNIDPETSSAAASALVVSPVAAPEPSTLALLLFGAGAGMIAKRIGSRR